MAGTEIAVRTSSDLAQLEDLEKLLVSGERPAEVYEDPEVISRQILMQLLDAETDEELESFGEATGWKTLLGVPVEIHNFTWRPSNYDEGAAVFFVVQGTRLDSAERVVLTTGSQNVLAQLCNLAKRGRIPGAIRMIVEGSETRQGYRPLWLKTPPGVSNDPEGDEG
jgi:hypothetical protein